MFFRKLKFRIGGIKPEELAGIVKVAEKYKEHFLVKLSPQLDEANTTFRPGEFMILEINGELEPRNADPAMIGNFLKEMDLIA